MKYILIGSDGFIGSNLIEVGRLCYTKFDSGFLKGSLSAGTTPIDITQDMSDLENYLKQLDEDFKVINLAAIHHIPYCNENPEEAIYTNVYGNRKLIELCKRHRCAHYIFASSGAVYKPCLENHAETDYLESSDIYSSSKILAENDIVNSDLNYSILRFFNIVGKQDFTPHLIPEVTNQILNGIYEIKVGNLSTVRDYIHVNDIVKIIELVLTDENPPAVFNCGTGRGTSGEEIIEIIKSIANREIDFEKVAHKFRKSDRPSQVSNNSLLREKYNFQSFETVEKGILDYFDWKTETRT